MVEKAIKATYTLHCGACGEDFTSREKSPKICSLCHSTLYRFREGDHINFAPQPVLIRLIEPIVRENIDGHTIINLKILDYNIGSKIPDWNSIIKQKRMKTLVSCLERINKNLIRTTKNDGITKSHLYYLPKDERIED